MAIHGPQRHIENTPDSQFRRRCATPLPTSSEDQIRFTRTLETPRGEPAIGTVFAGRYLIIEELGKGGMGRVFKAFDQWLEEEAALKLARKISRKNVGRVHETFLSLWKAADQERAEVADARARVAKETG